MGRGLKGLVVSAAYSWTCFFLLLGAALLASCHLLPFDSSSWMQMPTWSHGSNTIQDRDQPLQFPFTRLLTGEDRTRLKKTGFSCHSDLHSKLCLMDKSVMINNTALEIYIPSNQSFSSTSVHPYALQDDKTAMSYVTPVKIIQGNNSLPTCQFLHDVPVVVFSSGGFTGNLFHEFNDIIIPLFTTCYHFRTRLQFLITDHQLWWVRKYGRILSELSRYDVINPAEDGGVHCFTGAVIGLKFHDFLTLNYTDIPQGYSTADFRHFLWQAYNLQVKNVSKTIEKPMLMLISRQKSRKFLNEGEMVEMMKEVGFEVITTTPDMMSNLEEFSSVVNSCSVMVGAHGAGLTNELFLGAGAVVVQVVPLGLEWPSSFYFGQPAIKMGLRYLEYKIEAEESSLWDTYGRDHPVIKDPQSIFAKGYYASRAVYVDGQNLKINLARFRETLKQAKVLIGQMMSAKHKV